MQNKTISFETAEAAVMQTWKSLLKQTNPYLVPILLPMIEHFKPLFQEFYDLGVSHGRTAQAVPEWISVEDQMPPVDETVLVCWDYAPEIEPEKEYTTTDENLDEYWPNCQDEPPTHWMPLPRVIKAQEPAND